MNNICLAVTSDFLKSSKDSHILTAASYTEKLWPKKSTIKISFDLSNVKNVKWSPLALLQGLRNKKGNKIKLDPLEEKIRELSPIEAIKKIVRERIQPIVGLDLIFVESNGDVRIGFDTKKGTWSLIGIDCLNSKKDVTMNFSWLDCGTIIHEFGHMLGLIHEHQNPKNNPIEWDVDEVYKMYKRDMGWNKETTYKNIILHYKKNQINGTNFDGESIMLYFFPSALTLNNSGTNPNHILSPNDVKYISKLYPGGQLSPNEFYKKTYGESIIENKIRWDIILYILLGIIIMYFIILYFK